MRGFITQNVITCRNMKFEHQKIDFEDLSNFQPNLNEILNALPKICRYNGRIPFHYSVGQHTCELAYYLESVGKLDLIPHILLHDAGEVYIGDMITPLKDLFYDFNNLDKRLEKKIYSFYGLSLDKQILDDVSFFDKLIGKHEMVQFGIYHKYFAMTFESRFNFRDIEEKTMKTVELELVNLFKKYGLKND